MTTIAYRDGILAGDQRLTEKTVILTDKLRKVFLLPDGSLFGASGDAEAGDLLMAGVREGNLMPSLPKSRELAAIRVTPDGKLWITEGYAWMEWPEPYAAIGSGKRHALAVLRYGHSAVEAVQAGIAGDVYSGGAVQTVKLKGKRK